MGDWIDYIFYGIVFLMFLPFLVSLFGQGWRWKVVALVLSIATLVLLGNGDLLQLLCWLGAWVAAGLAIRAAKAGAYVPI